MRTKKEIEQSVLDSLKNTKLAEVGQEHLSLHILEVLLDIRDLLQNPPVTIENQQMDYREHRYLSNSDTTN